MLQRLPPAKELRKEKQLNRRSTRAEKISFSYRLLALNFKESPNYKIPNKLLRNVYNNKHQEKQYHRASSLKTAKRRK